MNGVFKTLFKSIAKEGEHEALERAVRDAARFAKEGNEAAFQKSMRDAAKHTAKGEIDEGLEKAIRDGLEEGLESGGKEGTKKSAYRRFMDSAKSSDGDVHYLMNGTGKFIKAPFKFAAHHPVIAGVGALGTYGAVTGEGGFKTAVNLAKWLGISKDNQDKGLVEGVSSDVIDAVAGEGSADKVKKLVGDGIEKGKEVMSSGKENFSDGFHDVRERVIEAYESGKGYLHSSSGEQSAMALPADMDWSNLTEEQKYYIAMLHQQQPATGGGIMNSLSNLSPMKSFQSLLGELFGGGKTTSIAAAIPAAMLMFGNYGWMAKIASVMLGGFAYKNAKQAQQQENMARQSTNGIFQIAGQSVMRTPAEQYALLSAAQDDTVYRGRGV